jgi:hypothetical protein
MKTHHLLVLLVAAAVAVIAALWTRTVHEPEHAAGAGALLAPGLEAKVNEVSTIHVKGKGDATVTLERGTDNWTVKEKSGYPADTGKVAKLLIGVAQSKLVEQKTSNPEHYAELGVADPGAAPPAEAKPDESDAKKNADEKPGALVEIDVPVEGADKVALVIGNSARGATATYVRKAGDSQSWLTSGDLTVQSDPLSWIDRQIMNVPANRIQSVTIRHPDGQTLTIDKNTREEPNYTVHDLPAKREVKFASVGNPVASVLSSLRLEDVAALAEHDPSAHSPITIEYRAFDGLVVTAQAYAEGDKRYVHYDAAFDEDLAKRFYVAPAPKAEDAATGESGAASAEKPASKDEAKAESTSTPAAGATSTAETPPAEGAAAPAAPAQPDFSATRQEAEKLDRTLQPWVFIVASYKYDQMNKHVSDMLKEEEQKGANKEPPKAGAKKPAPPKPEPVPNPNE